MSRPEPPDLFGPAAQPPDPEARHQPLAERLRPRALDQILGQDHLLGEAGALSPLLSAGTLPSLILWGPPGVGKTTLARLLAGRVGLEFVQISAIFSGVADLKRVFEDAARAERTGRRTLLFVDEIHRFNRAQQDGFLPYVERGTITLVGATTENPSFALNGALLSRCQVLVLRRLEAAELHALLARAEAATGQKLALTDGARAALVAMADGDGRALLNLAESAARLGPGPIDEATLGQRLARRAPLYDRDRDGHYALISALHKSLRGSDPDAALYWLARMLDGGEDPRFLLRRLTRFASEDVGLADPTALVAAIAAWDAYDRLGSPEGELAIAQVTLHLATAPKSVSATRAFGAAMAAARRTGSLMPPAHIRNAPTALMRTLGHGAGYAYDPDQPDGFSGQTYFPDGMPREAFYRPSENGAERRIAERLAHWTRLREERS